jgi:hypothetical protein
MVDPERITEAGEMIKNYTSGVPVDRTLARIEAALVRGGATNIAKDYKDNMLCAVNFTTVNPADGQRISVRLPANADGVYNALRESVKRPRAGTLEKLREQANRTAWKLMQDWIEIQMSLIAMQQAEFLQVFLPYVWDGHKTFYTALKAGGFKMLTSGTKS